jgi:hypothetical protein
MLPFYDAANHLQPLFEKMYVTLFLKWREGGFGKVMGVFLGYLELWPNVSMVRVSICDVLYYCTSATCDPISIT